MIYDAELLEEAGRSWLLDEARASWRSLKLNCEASMTEIGLIHKNLKQIGSDFDALDTSGKMTAQEIKTNIADNAVINLTWLLNSDRIDQKKHDFWIAHLIDLDLLPRPALRPLPQRVWPISAAKVCAKTPSRAFRTKQAALADLTKRLTKKRLAQPTVEN